MSGRIFISHSSKDRNVADRLMEAIERRGYPCWISSRDLRGNYQAEIVKAITACPAMILLFSRNANRSEEILKEISLASRNGKVVIPVRIEDVLPTGAMEYELTTRNWVDFFRNRDEALDRVTEHLVMVNGGLPSPLLPPPPIRSLRPAALWSGAGLAAAAIVAFLGWSYVTSDPALAYPDAPPETPSTQVNSFRMTLLVGTHKVDRRWTRISPLRWYESYVEPGKSSVSSGIEIETVKRMILANCAGTVLREIGTSRKYAFVPDRGCPDMAFRINHDGGGWGIAAEMVDVQ